MNITANIYKDFITTLVLHKKRRKIPIKKGVRQGDTISPVLFTACLEEVFKLLDWESLVVIINREYLSNLWFADDIVLFSKNGDELQQMIDDLNRESVRVGLKMNMRKTKIIESFSIAENVCVSVSVLRTLNLCGTLFDRVLA